MREILFRGKRVDNGGWAYGSLIIETNPFDKDMVMTHIYDNFYNEILVDPRTIGQYTGLCDRNGTKIFEGDILHAAQGDFVVRWSESICSFVAGEKERIRPCVNSGTMNCCEVIGNIFDNPELLEGKGWRK